MCFCKEKIEVLESKLKDPEERGTVDGTRLLKKLKDVEPVQGVSPEREVEGLWRQGWAGVYAFKPRE